MTVATKLTAQPNAASVLQALSAGHAAKQAEHAVKEQARLGTLSGGGSVGAILADGSYVGTCPRIALLRAQGVSEVHTTDTLDMFSHGESNEVIVAELLERSGMQIKRDVALEYTLKDGRKVSSHLDFVVYDEAGNPSLVIETKAVCSFWTARSIAFDLEPKSSHLIQLAHYMHQAGTPGVLLYSSRVDWHLSVAPAWLQKRFTPGTPYTEFKDDGTPLKIRPFNVTYDVYFGADGFLYYHTEGLEQAVRTKLTAASITKFYDAVSKSLTVGEVLPRPSDKHISGSKAYKPCLYCKASAACDKYEGAGYQTWRDHAERAIAEDK